MKRLLMKTYKNNTSGVKGVSRTKNGTYSAKLTYQGKTITQKRFKTLEEAQSYLSYLRKSLTTNNQ